MANDDMDLDDRELPDESDMDQDEEDESAETRNCPHCGLMILEEAEVCPRCGRVVSGGGAGGSPKALWFVAAVIICLIVVWELWIR